MAKICTISDESDTSGDETVQVEANQGATESHSKHQLSVQQTSRAELMPRFRNLSINEEDFQEATDGKSEAGDGDPFRPRSRSAPPAFWAAKKYGRELRRMSDEFEKGVVDKGMRKVRSAGTASQMRTSRSWFTYLWSHQESDSETMSSLTTQNTRPAE